MKAKVNIPTRGKSNPPLKNLVPSSLLEEQTKRMEQQLKDLKDALAQKSQGVKEGEGSRWQSANTDKPIKNYAKQVLENKVKPSLNSTGGRVPVNKPRSREIGSREKPASREKLPALTTSTTNNPLTTSTETNKENKDFFKDTFMPSPSPSNSFVSINRTPTQAQKGKTVTQSEDRAAANNLMKALSNQKESNEVEKFLSEIGLPQYTQTFLDNGFDDLETVLEIQTKHLVEMKIPAGHQIKLTKKLDSLRGTNPAEQKIIMPSPAKGVVKSEGVNMEKVMANSKGFYGQSANQYVELEGPKKEMAIGESKGQGGELLQGTFDEAESHQSFLEALNEWRNAGKSKATVEVEKKKESREKAARAKKVVKFSEPVKEEEPAGEDDVDYISSKPRKSNNKPKEAPKEESKSFFFMGGGSSWNAEDIPGNKDGATDMSPKSHPKPKISCWNCYKLAAESEVKKLAGKNFCSEPCVKIYKDMNSAKCVKKGCSKSFLKEDGVMKEGHWFCSEGHVATKEEILMEEQMKIKQGSKDSKVPVQKSNNKGGNEISEDEYNDGDDDDVDFELSVDLNNNKKEALTLAELEEKYKNMN